MITHWSDRHQMRMRDELFLTERELKKRKKKERRLWYVGASKPTLNPVVAALKTSQHRPALRKVLVGSIHR